MRKAISIPPSYHWTNYGTWSTFAVQIGTPSQVLEVLPSTSGDSIWVVVSPDGCYNEPFSQDNCSRGRGGLFDIGSSSTFNWIGSSKLVYSLPFGPESALGGNYSQASAELLCYSGTDTAVLGYSGAGVPTLQNQLILGYAVKIPYQGLLGLTPRPHNFSIKDTNTYGLKNITHSFNSALGTLRKKSLIPSSYWAYTAGAYYKEPRSFGSLTFGGYDALRGNKHDVMTVPLGVENNRDLLVKIKDIKISSGVESTTIVADLPINAFIDSVIPEIWLPTASCASFESAFGLTWNEDLSMYLVNDTQEKHLVSQNPTVTFSLGAATSEDSFASTQITFPYRAFDQIASYPLVGAAQGAVRYFPLKRAVHEDQITLGRTFLQEAYVAVDYDRSQFSISQATFPADGSWTNIKTVNPPGSSRLSTGTIVGIAISVAAVIIGLIIGLRGWFIVRRKRDKGTTNQRTPYVDTKAELSTTDPLKNPLYGSELGSRGEVYEIGGVNKPAEMGDEARYELDGGWHGHEARDTSNPT